MNDMLYDGTLFFICAGYTAFGVIVARIRWHFVKDKESYDEAQFAAITAGLIWPFAVPYWFLLFVADHIAKEMKS